MYRPSVYILFALNTSTSSAAITSYIPNVSPVQCHNYRSLTLYATRGAKAALYSPSLVSIVVVVEGNRIFRYS